MKITISDRRNISAIQKEFNDAFPYLKIEFFSKPHSAGGPSPKKFMKDPSKTIGECRTIRKSGTISITSATTVTELEQKLRNNFGLSVQIFRKSGKAWLETTVTDSWSLEKQNNQGEALSNYLISGEARENYQPSESD